MAVIATCRWFLSGGGSSERGRSPPNRTCAEYLCVCFGKILYGSRIEDRGPSPNHHRCSLPTIPPQVLGPKSNPGHTLYANYLANPSKPPQLCHNSNLATSNNYEVQKELCLEISRYLLVASLLNKTKWPQLVSSNWSNPHSGPLS